MEDTKDDVMEVELSENIPIKYFAHSMLFRLAHWLDPENTVAGNDWRLLAEKLGYTTQDILVFHSRQSHHGSNTVKVLTDYSQKQGSSVNKLFQALREISRPDALSDLAKCIPEIEKAYRKDQEERKHRRKELTENNFVCASCDSYRSYSESTQKTMMSQGNGYSMFSSGERSNALLSSDPSRHYQRHRSEDHACVYTRVNGYEHNSPEFKRQRSMPLSDSMEVRGYNSQSQFYQEMEPMDQGSLREDPVPVDVGIMRNNSRYNPQPHSSESIGSFRQPFPSGQFNVQTGRPGLKLNIPSPTDLFHQQRTAEFCSPSPTPTTPSTPLGHLQKLANARTFQPGEEYKDLMKLKRDEELLQGKADKLLEYMSQKMASSCSRGNQGESQDHLRTSPRPTGPPNTFPLRVKSSSSTSSPSPPASLQLTKSASLPSNMKPAEFRKAFRHIKVFVTYSADDKKHVQRVLSLCKCLEKNGFTCCIDIFRRRLLPEEKADWCQKRFGEADFILVVMSPKYREEVDSCDVEDDDDDSDSYESCNSDVNDLNNGGHKLHTKTFYKLMYEEYIRSGSRCMRFVPLIFPGMCKDIIPRWLMDCNNNLSYFWPKQYKDLLWMLTKPENRVPDHVTLPVNRCLQDEDDTCLTVSQNSIESE